MDIARVDILDEDKLESKHNVRAHEAEQVLWSNARFFFAEKGNIEGEDVYRALGRTDGGRYLVVIFIHKRDDTAFILSARDMTKKERKRYDKK